VLCTAADCDRDAICREWCKRHYLRWYRSGSTDVNRYAKGDGSYKSVHKRLRLRRGRAADFPCSSCGRPAHDWALQRDVAPVKVDRLTGLLFSNDLAAYVPLCKSCHVRLDGTARRVREAS
jgi:hypothetical protein